MNKSIWTFLGPPSHSEACQPCGENRELSQHQEVVGGETGHRALRYQESKTTLFYFEIKNLKYFTDWCNLRLELWKPYTSC